MVEQRSPKPLVWVQLLHPLPSLYQWIERFLNPSKNKKVEHLILIVHDILE